MDFFINLISGGGDIQGGPTGYEDLPFARLCDETHPGKIFSHPPQDQGLSPHSSVFGFEHF